MATTRERTKEELYREAKRMGVKGRSKMNKDQLKAAVDAERRNPYTRLRQAVEVRKAREAFETETLTARPADPGSTPTAAMLALGTKAASWSTAIVVIAFVLVIVLLGNELGVIDAVHR